MNTSSSGLEQVHTFNVSLLRRQRELTPAPENNVGPRSHRGLGTAPVSNIEDNFNANPLQNTNNGERAAGCYRAGTILSSEEKGRGVNAPAGGRGEPSATAIEMACQDSETFAAMPDVGDRPTSGI